MAHRGTGKQRKQWDRRFRDALPLPLAQIYHQAALAEDIEEHDVALRLWEFSTQLMAVCSICQYGEMEVDDPQLDGLVQAKLIEPTFTDWRDLLRETARRVAEPPGGASGPPVPQFHISLNRRLDDVDLAMCHHGLRDAVGQPSPVAGPLSAFDLLDAAVEYRAQIARNRIRPDVRLSVPLLRAFEQFWTCVQPLEGRSLLYVRQLAHAQRWNIQWMDLTGMAPELCATLSLDGKQAPPPWMEAYTYLSNGSGQPELELSPLVLFDAEQQAVWLYDRRTALGMEHCCFPPRGSRRPARWTTRYRLLSTLFQLELRPRTVVAVSGEGTPLRAAPETVPPVAAAPGAGATPMPSSGLPLPAQAALNQPTGPAPPLLLGRWQLLRELGQGGMGVVYYAFDTVIRQEVAIKRLVAGPRLGEAVERMRNEARLARSLNHPAIARTYEFHVAGDECFIVMEYIAGRTLDSLLQERPKLTPHETIDVVRQVAAGLEHAHAKDVVHRDIKPANIMLTYDGDSSYLFGQMKPAFLVKILDFGIAKALADVRAGSTRAGTLGYMAPEILLARRYDRRVDVFALGMMTYQMLTGEMPYGESAMMLPSVRPRPAAGFSSELSEILAKAVAWDPESRWLSAAAFVTAVAAALARETGAPVVAGPASSSYRPSSLTVGNVPGQAALTSATPVTGTGAPWPADRTETLEPGEPSEEIEPAPVAVVTTAPPPDTKASGANVHETPRLTVAPAHGGLEVGKRGQVDLLDDRYQLVDFIDEGAYAEVYQGRDVRLERPVAIKMLKVEHTRDPARRIQLVRVFRREAQTLVSLQHPNIVEVLDANVTPSGIPYIVLQYLEGELLSDVLRGAGPLALDRAETLMGYLCAAIQAAHESGVIHRDLKPANIMLLKVRGRESLKVLDFGLARLVDQTQMTLTAPGRPIGTVHYMSPEQAKGDEAHAASDIYAIGVILFEMLTGRLPYQARDVEELRRLHEAHATNPPDPAAIKPDLPAPVCTVIRRTLEIDANRRPASAVELGEQFRAAVCAAEPSTQGHPVLATALGPPSSATPIVAPDSRATPLFATVEVAATPPAVVAAVTTPPVGAGPVAASTADGTGTLPPQPLTAATAACAVPAEAASSPGTFGSAPIAGRAQQKPTIVAAAEATAVAPPVVAEAAAVGLPAALPATPAATPTETDASTSAGPAAVPVELVPPVATPVETDPGPVGWTVTLPPLVEPSPESNVAENVAPGRSPEAPGTRTSAGTWVSGVSPESPVVTQKAPAVASVEAPHTPASRGEQAQTPASDWATWPHSPPAGTQPATPTPAASPKAAAPRTRLSFRTAWVGLAILLLVGAGTSWLVFGRKTPTPVPLPPKPVSPNPPAPQPSNPLDEIADLAKKLTSPDWEAASTLRQKCLEALQSVPAQREELRKFANQGRSLGYRIVSSLLDEAKATSDVKVANSKFRQAHDRARELAVFDTRWQAARGPMLSGSGEDPSRILGSWLAYGAARLDSDLEGARAVAGAITSASPDNTGATKLSRDAEALLRITESEGRLRDGNAADAAKGFAAALERSTFHDRPAAAVRATLGLARARARLGQWTDLAQPLRELQSAKLTDEQQAYRVALALLADAQPLLKGETPDAPASRIADLLEAAAKLQKLQDRRDWEAAELARLVDRLKVLAPKLAGDITPAEELEHLLRVAKGLTAHDPTQQFEAAMITAYVQYRRQLLAECRKTLQAAGPLPGANTHRIDELRALVTAADASAKPDDAKAAAELLASALKEQTGSRTPFELAGALYGFAKRDMGTHRPLVVTGLQAAVNEPGALSTAQAEQVAAWLAELRGTGLTDMIRSDLSREEWETAWRETEKADHKDPWLTLFRAECILELARHEDPLPEADAKLPMVADLVAWNQEKLPDSLAKADGYAYYVRALAAVKSRRDTSDFTRAARELGQINVQKLPAWFTPARLRQAVGWYEQAAGQLRKAPSSPPKLLENPFRDADQAVAWLDSAAALAATARVQPSLSAQTNRALATWFKKQPDKARVRELTATLVAQQPASALGHELLLAAAQAQEDTPTGKATAFSCYEKVLGLEREGALSIAPQQTETWVSFWDQVLKPALELGDALVVDQPELKPRVALLYARKAQLAETHLNYLSQPFRDPELEATKAYQRAAELHGTRDATWADYVVRRAFLLAMRQPVDVILLRKLAQDAGSAAKNNSAPKFLNGLAGLYEAIGDMGQIGTKAYGPVLDDIVEKQLNQAIELAKKETPPPAFLDLYYSIRGAALVLRGNHRHFENARDIARFAADFEQARADAVRATELQPRYDWYPYLVLGNALEDLAWLCNRPDAMPLYDQAFSAFQESTSRRETNAVAWLARGRVNFKRVVDSRGEPSYLERAESDLSEAVARASKGSAVASEAGLWLAMTRLHRNDHTGGSKAADEALGVLAPQHAGLALQLVRLELDVAERSLPGEPQRSLLNTVWLHCQRIGSIAPTFRPQIAAIVARSYSVARDFQKARETCEQELGDRTRLHDAHFDLLVMSAQLSVLTRSDLMVGIHDADRACRLTSSPASEAQARGWAGRARYEAALMAASTEQKLQLRKDAVLCLGQAADLAPEGKNVDTWRYFAMVGITGLLTQPTIPVEDRENYRAQAQRHAKALRAENLPAAAKQVLKDILTAIEAPVQP